MSAGQTDEKSIFTAAIAMRTPAEREAYLEEACGPDPALRARICALLDARGIESDFLAEFSPTPETLVNDLEETPGTMIGRYRILDKIGEGGMAVVYSAEQREPVHRRVALKIIKLGMDTKQVIARFEAERQALAVMDHPNIAKVFDGGATTAGRPYFVMELVKGVSITEYCDVNGLDTRERLLLFVRVCGAVHHAHQKGIIHRDIKPSNVMVTLNDDEAIPKVIDFGIAKATNHQLTEKTLFTHCAQMIGTPEYMSPEQAQMSGLDVDTRTDIYSLGVLLYELLTGATPLDSEEFRRAGYGRIQELLRDTEPLRPSAKLNTLGDALRTVAERHRTDSNTLRRAIRGDLDWIVMKCLEKDRARRYETVHDLVADIQRHLRHEAVLAGSPGMAYRLRKFWQRRRHSILAAAAVMVFVAGTGVSAVAYRSSRRIQWAKAEALPEIVSLVERGDFLAAFSLAKRAERYIPADSSLIALWPRVCRNLSVDTIPAGASIFFRENSVNNPWQYLGRSPLENIRFPHGVYRWKIEKTGYEEHECVASYPRGTQLRKQGSLPADMVLVRPETFEVGAGASREAKTVEASPYLIDKYEVTNEQFKQFMDEAGYRNPVSWQGQVFSKDGRDLSWQEAVEEFRDRTGEAGPATWEHGDYPAGQGNHPVCGVSWHEAVAYAKFAGKSLPTIYHWEHAACLDHATVIVPFSNFGPGGTAPVGRYGGMGDTGLYDMAGNVKEWCWNATDDVGSQRYILGGAWGEQAHMFTMRDSQSPWNRSPVNGFRCVQYPQEGSPVADVFFHPVQQRPIGSPAVGGLLSEEAYEILKESFEYDRTALNASVEHTDEGSPHWRREKIVFDAAYGGERVIAYLFLPRTSKPPYQIVVYSPGADALQNRPFDGLPQADVTQFVIQNGRSLLYPVYKGTYDRPQRPPGDWTPPSVTRTPMAYRDWLIQIVKDLRRSIDYVETRTDIDADKMAYYGFSWGAAMGPVVLATEDRFKAGILLSGGLGAASTPQELNAAHYARRVTTPILMLNGAEDAFFPLKTSQIPLFELLGTPNEHKQHRLYPGGHILTGLFGEQIRADVVAWLDRYLGPVKRTSTSQ